MKSHAQNLSLPLPFETNIQQGQKLCKYHFFVIHHKEIKMAIRTIYQTIFVPSQFNIPARQVNTYRVVFIRTRP